MNSNTSPDNVNSYNVDIDNVNNSETCHAENMAMRFPFFTALRWYVMKHVENRSDEDLEGEFGFAAYEQTEGFFSGLVEYCQWLLSLIVGSGIYQQKFGHLVEYVSDSNVSITIDRLNLFYTFIGMQVTEMDSLDLKNLLDLKAFIEFLLTGLRGYLESLDILKSFKDDHLRWFASRSQHQQASRQHRGKQASRQPRDSPASRQPRDYSVAAPVTPSVAAPVTPSVAAPVVTQVADPVVILIPTLTVYGRAFAPKPVSNRTGPTLVTSVTGALSEWLKRLSMSDSTIGEALRKYRNSPFFTDTFKPLLSNARPQGWKVYYKELGLLQPDHNTPFAVGFTGNLPSECWIYTSPTLGNPKIWIKVSLLVMVKFYLENLMIKRLLKEVDPDNLDTWCTHPDGKFYLPNGDRYSTDRADLTGYRPTSWVVEREERLGAWSIVSRINYVYPK